MMGKGHGDRSGACAYVDEAQFRSLREAMQDGFDEKLGLWAGDECGAGDAEGQAVELLLAEDVLNRLEGQPAVDEIVDARRLAWAEKAVGAGVERGWA